MLSNSHRTYRAGLGSIALIGMLWCLASTGAWAQAASNVDCNKCVDTGDIAKKAVEKKQLAKDSITSNRIADGTIKAKDLADSAVEESKLTAGAVTSGKLADGAVTAAKLAADAVFGRIIVIRADPIDTAGNCDALLAALAAITDNDADNRYLIYLEPGVYECGTSAVEMKAYVDIQGSGRGVTRISGRVGGEGIALLYGASNAEVRQLAVESQDGPDGFAIAIGSNADSFRVTDVSAIARNSENVLAIGLIGGGSSVLTNVTALAINPSNAPEQVRALIVNDSSTHAELVNVIARATDGASVEDTGLIVGNGATAVARNSVFSGGDFAISANGGTANIVSSQIDGDKDPSSTGTFNCVGAYDGAFASLNSTCD